MKKITLIAVAFIAVSFASCKKAKTCSCTTTNSSTNNSVTVSTSSSDVTSYDKLSSGDVNALCPKTTTDSYTTGGGNGTTQHTDTRTCTLS